MSASSSAQHRDRQRLRSQRQQAGVCGGVNHLAARQQRTSATVTRQPAGWADHHRLVAAEQDRQAVPLDWRVKATDHPDAGLAQRPL